MMKKWLIGCLLICFSAATQAQSFKPSTEIGVFMGTSYYIGDLNENHFELAQPAIGLIYRNNLNRRFTLKASAWTGEIRGNDKINNVDTSKIRRNLHFRSPIMELSGQVEFNFFEYETGSKRYPFSPFIFTGISFYKHNPQARRWNTENPFDRDGYGSSNEWIELQPLGTEGQNSVHYPGKDPYSLTQIAIPLGVGIKWSLGEKFSLVAEYGMRKTFTDYLDDVGGTYADPQYLNAEDQIAAQLSHQISYQGVEPPIPANGTAPSNADWLAYWQQLYPNGYNETQRANENNWNDWYTFAGITLSFKIVKTPKVCQF